MNVVFTVCGACVLLLVFVTVIKQIRPEYALLLSVLGGVLLLLPVLRTLSSVKELSDFIPAELTSRFLPVWKGVGIVLLCDIVSGICRDMGESSLAAQVEFAGRVSLLLLAVAPLKELLQNVLSFL